MFVCCECCVLSGRGLCDELIIRPEESYRLWCVVLCDLETSRTGTPYIYIFIYIYIYIYIYDISSLRVKMPRCEKTQKYTNIQTAVCFLQRVNQHFRSLQLCEQVIATFVESH